MVDFQIIEHTADVGIAAYGKGLREVFANAARGLFSVMIEGPIPSGDRRQVVKVSASDVEALLVEWLNELIYLFEVKGLIFGRFDIKELSDTTLEADCYGNEFDPQRHRVKMGVKATTYHMLKIEEQDGYRAQVLFDI